jgi:hypothetical protein
MLVYEKGRVAWRLAIDILHGHRSAFAFGLPWDVDVIAMVMGKVEQGSGMASVENGLENTALRIRKQTEQRLPTRRVHPTGRGSTRMALRS